MIKVIAFDPGVTTGFATGEITHDGLMKVKTAQAQFTKKELFDWLDAYKPDFVISESFEYRNQARQGLILESKELMGVIQLWCEVNGVPYKEQSPGYVIGKTAHFTDAKLKLSGIYRRGHIHANEAAKHLLYWYKFGRGSQFNKKGFELGTD